MGDIILKPGQKGSFYADSNFTISVEKDGTVKIEYSGCFGVKEIVDERMKEASPEEVFLVERDSDFYTYAFRHAPHEKVYYHESSLPSKVEDVLEYLKQVYGGDTDE